MKEKILNIVCSILIGFFIAFCLFITDDAPKEKETPSIPSETVSEVYLTREEADTLEARNGEGRWAEPIEATPDHISQEKIDDKISESFDLMCDVVYAESGNQGDKGMRLVADVIINRMRDGDATLHDVLTANNQFSCVSDGGAAKWRGHDKEKVRKIVQEELMNPINTEVYYFRTGFFSPYGRDLFKYGDHYFSARKERATYSV